MIPALLTRLAQVDITTLPDPDTSKTIPTILGIVFGIAGAVCVLMITISGMRYIMSRGEPQAVNQAKSSILYALVGLVICIMGYAIVSFVVRKVS